MASNNTKPDIADITQDKIFHHNSSILSEGNRRTSLFLINKDINLVENLSYILSTNAQQDIVNVIYL